MGGLHSGLSASLSRGGLYFLGDDLFDLGDLNLEADGLPQSYENSRLALKLPYLTLDRAAAEISIHYGQELAVVRKMGGGRIPHILVLV